MSLSDKMSLWPIRSYTKIEKGKTQDKFPFHFISEFIVNYFKLDLFNLNNSSLTSHVHINK